MMTPEQNKRWAAYLMEAFGLWGFVTISGLANIFTEHPNMPVMESWLKDYPMLRRAPLGIIIGLYIMCVSQLFSKKSGAHFNPAITWTFYRLGTIKLKDVVLYTVAQFLGAVIASFVLKFAFDKWFSHPNIHYGITKPLEPHTSTGAFIAEIIISFITMWTILVSSTSKKLEKKLPLIMSVLLACFIIFESPYSGMSMNPARSFAGAAAAGKWNYLWIYFVAPSLAMLFAAELYLVWKRKKISIHLVAPNSKQDDLQRLKDYPAV